MSLHGGRPVQCQSLSLTQQYEAGIRFVDIRCRHFDDGLPIHHDVGYQHANFDDVLKTTMQFLDAHTMEIVFMRVKEEYQPENNTTTFAEAVQLHVSRFPSRKFWHGEGFPTMKEARGKLVILRDYDGAASFGLSYANLDIEDQWQVESLMPKDINKKRHNVRSHLEKARQGPINTMYLTYSSGASVLAWPHAVSEQMNLFLLDFFNSKARWVTVAMDFPDSELIGRIIQTNL